MKIKRKIIEIDESLCDGCGQCVPQCAEGALQIIDGKARLVQDKLCDGLGACLGECPTGALKIIEREADEFDEEAVEHHLAAIDIQEEKTDALACGCPSTKIETFQPAGRIGSDTPDVPSALSHWPVQIRLIPPKAPFLKNAHLLITADCAPVAYPGLHRDLLPGKVVMIGCPKFDEVQEYISRFAQIFKTANIRHITVVTMEVPCCSGLPMIVQKAMNIANVNIPMDEIVIGARGDIIRETRQKAS